MNVPVRPPASSPPPGEAAQLRAVWSKEARVGLQPVGLGLPMSQWG